ELAARIALEVRHVPAAVEDAHARVPALRPGELGGQPLGAHERGGRPDPWGALGRLGPSGSPLRCARHALDLARSFDGAARARSLAHVTGISVASSGARAPGSIRL